MGSLPWHEVPEAWKPLLRTHLRATCGEDREQLSASDFRSDQSVRLHFEDGSFAVFRYAFVLLDKSGERCIVFTEHCGYHVFPVGSCGVEVVRTVPFHEGENADQDVARDQPRD